MPNLEKGRIYAIAGHMASGKSSLLEQMRQMGVVVFGELPITQNPNFSDYSTALRAGIKPNPHALGSQLEFLKESVRQAQEIKRLRAEDPEVTIIWEMPPWGHLMFAWLQHLNVEDEQPIMSAEDWEVYCKEFKLAWQQIIELGVLPDVVIVTIIKDIGAIMARIDERGRPEEKEIPVEFIAAQSKYWTELLSQGNLIPLEVMSLLGLSEVEYQAMTPKLLELDAQRFNWKLAPDNHQGISETLQHITQMVA